MIHIFLGNFFNERFLHIAQGLFLTDLLGRRYSLSIYTTTIVNLNYHAGMVIYVYPTPENKRYELPNPRPIQRKIIQPEFPPKYC